jgi:hypothetical protein
VPAWARWHGIVAPPAILPIPKFWDNMKNEKKEKEKRMHISQDMHVTATSSKALALHPEFPCD